MKIDYDNLTEEQIEEFIEIIDWDEVPDELLLTETTLKFIDDFDNLKEEVYAYIGDKVSYKRKDKFFYKQLFNAIEKKILDNEYLLLLCCQNLDILEFIVKQGVKFGEHAESAFEIVAENGRFEEVKFFIEQGVNVNCNDDSALLEACFNGVQTKVIRILLENGANPKAQESQAIINTIQSHQKNSLEVLKLLVKYGADPKAHESLSLLLAFDNGDVDMAKFLIKQGVDFESKKEYGIEIAISEGHLELAKFLLENGAPVKDDYLLTPIYHRNVEFVELLVKHGAKVSDQKIIDRIKKVCIPSDREKLEKILDIVNQYSVV